MFGQFVLSGVLRLCALHQAKPFSFCHQCRVITQLPLPSTHSIRHTQSVHVFFDSLRHCHPDLMLVFPSPWESLGHSFQYAPTDFMSHAVLLRRALQCDFHYSLLSSSPPIIPLFRARASAMNSSPHIMIGYSCIPSRTLRVSTRCQSFHQLLHLVFLSFSYLVVTLSLLPSFAP